MSLRAQTAEDKSKQDAHTKYADGMQGMLVLYNKVLTISQQKSVSGERGGFSEPLIPPVSSHQAL